MFPTNCRRPRGGGATIWRKHLEEEIVMAKITQTAGRNALGEFAPEFAHFNDDVLLEKIGTIRI